MAAAVAAPGDAAESGANAARLSLTDGEDAGKGPGAARRLESGLVALGVGVGGAIVVASAAGTEASEGSEAGRIAGIAAGAVSELGAATSAGMLGAGAAVGVVAGATARLAIG